MRYFTSGIGDERLGLIAARSVRSVLVDLVDLPNVIRLFIPQQIAIDSGAYRLFKDPTRQGQPPTDDEAQAYIRHLNSYAAQFEMVMALDAIGNPERTLALYKAHFRDTRGILFTPVYQWGAPEKDLDYYLRWAPTRCFSSGYTPSMAAIVALGGLAPLLRGGHNEKDPARKKELDALRDRTIDEVEALCQRYPRRFHLLGLNSPESINRLSKYLVSADSSKWLDARRYRYAIFVSTATGKLQHAPARAIPGFAHLDTDNLLGTNAYNITHYAESIPCVSEISADTI